MLSTDSLTRIEEIMTDLAVMELCVCFEAFVDFLVARAQPSKAHRAERLTSLRRSVSDTSLGETDVEIVMQDDSGRSTALLIENKIRAPIMSRQFERYQLRGKAGIEAGSWDQFFVGLTSPKTYFDQLLPEHAKHIDFHVSYEHIVEWLNSQSSPLFEFKKYVFNQSLQDYKKGYEKKHDFAMTKFYQNYWQVASRDYPELRMVRPELVGKDGSWIYFPGIYGDKSVRLLHKFKVPSAELGIMTRNGEALSDALASQIETSMTLRPKASWLFVTIPTTVIDHTADFESVKLLVHEGLGALRTLHSFALRPKVKQTIQTLR